MIRRHTASGWTREFLRDGSSRVKVTPTDDSGIRIVRFLSAHSWANDPADDKANQDQDRVVLLDGAALPDWAITWLTDANTRSCANGRAALRAAIDDADNTSFGGGW